METKETKNYEISFLTHTEEGVGLVIKHLNQLGAQIVNEGKIEQRRLAYPIKKHESAYFGCIQFALDPENVHALKEAIKFDKSILRYLVVTPPISTEANQRKNRVQKQERIQKEIGDGVLSNEDLEAKLEEILQ